MKRADFRDILNGLASDGNSKDALEALAAITSDAYSGYNVQSVVAFKETAEIMDYTEKDMALAMRGVLAMYKIANENSTVSSSEPIHIIVSGIDVSQMSDAEIDPYLERLSKDA